eukprot:511403-Amphidinium_carterae.3
MSFQYHDVTCHGQRSHSCGSECCVLSAALSLIFFHLVCQGGINIFSTDIEHSQTPGIPMRADALTKVRNRFFPEPAQRASQWPRSISIGVRLNEPVVRLMTQRLLKPISPEENRLAFILAVAEAVQQGAENHVPRLATLCATQTHACSLESRHLFSCILNYKVQQRCGLQVLDDWAKVIRSTAVTFVIIGSEEDAHWKRFVHVIDSALLDTDQAIREREDISHEFVAMRRSALQRAYEVYAYKLRKERSEARTFNSDDIANLYSQVSLASVSDVASNKEEQEHSKRIQQV